MFFKYVLQYQNFDIGMKTATMVALVQQIGTAGEAWDGNLDYRSTWSIQFNGIRLEPHPPTGGRIVLYFRIVYRMPQQILNYRSSICTLRVNASKRC